MAKVIQLENGERMIVSDNTPDDLTYDFGRLGNRVLTSSIIEKLKDIPQKAMLDPIALLLSVQNPDHPEIPIHLSSYKQAVSGRVSISGSMLTSDFAWMLENKISVVLKMTLVTDKHPYDITSGAPLQITVLRAESMNAVTVNVSLSLTKTT